jgi:hypothetical protein
MASLKELAKFIRAKLRQDDDLVIVVDGREGKGKSTLAIMLGFEVNFEDFNLTNSVLYSPKVEEMKDKMQNSPRYATIVADESIKALYKHNWQKQTYINMLFNVVRQENKCAILVLPRFTDLNEYFRNHRCYLYIHVFERGKAVVFAYDSMIGTNDPWRIKENYALIRKRLNNKLPDFVPYEKYASALMSCSNFLMMLEFPAMPKGMSDEYKALKDKFKYEGLENEEGEEGESDNDNKKVMPKGLSHYKSANTIAAVETALCKAYLFLKNENKFNQSTVLETLDISGSTMNQILKRTILKNEPLVKTNRIKRHETEFVTETIPKEVAKEKIEKIEKISEKFHQLAEVALEEFANDELVQNEMVENKN